MKRGYTRVSDPMHSWDHFQKSNYFYPIHHLLQMNTSDNNTLPLSPSQLSSIAEVEEEDVDNCSEHSLVDDCDTKPQTTTRLQCNATLYIYKDMVFQSLNEVDKYFDKNQLKGFVDIKSSNEDPKAFTSSIYIDRTNNYINY